MLVDGLLAAEFQTHVLGWHSACMQVGQRFTVGYWWWANTGFACHLFPGGDSGVTSAVVIPCSIPLLSVLVAWSPSCTSTVSLAELRFPSASKAALREHLGKLPVSDSESTLQSWHIWLQGFGRCFCFYFCLWRCCCVRCCLVFSILWPCQNFKTEGTGWV